jgi:hypothetical protein
MTASEISRLGNLMIYLLLLRPSAVHFSQVSRCHPWCRLLPPLPKTLKIEQNRANVTL